MPVTAAIDIQRDFALAKFDLVICTLSPGFTAAPAAAHGPLKRHSYPQARRP